VGFPHFTPSIEITDKTVSLVVRTSLAETNRDEAMYVLKIQTLGSVGI